MLNLLRLFEVA